MDMPIFKDWKERLQQDLEQTSNKKDDLVKISLICDGYSKEIESLRAWATEQQRFVNGVKAHSDEFYRLRFNSEPVGQSEQKAALPQQTTLNTSESRQQTIRAIALEITKVGAETNCEALLKELERRNIKLEGNNPKAIIATILNGFKSRFEKVGKGVFKRKE
jgi:hypothetical protein